MIAKLLLPRLGGSPAVWGTCLVFFQAILLAGYVYAHLLTTRLKPKAQIAVHLLVVLPLAALSLPLDLGQQAPPTDSNPAPWLLLQLLLHAGPVMFALTATAPLLQAWFAVRPGASNPYALYAGSNAGSLLALLAYPFLIEPGLDLPDQARIWSLVCGLLAVALALCGIATLRAPAAPAQAQGQATITWRQRVHWTALAFVPSSLLLGVTSHITMDIAAIPLLWVVPLALYLFTFVLTFASSPPLPHGAVLRALPLILIVLVTMAWPGAGIPLPFLMLIGLHLLGFFALALACHGELARLRPPPAGLTDFYVFMSIGGVLGGSFNALLAPVLFSDLHEYGLAIVLGLLLLPSRDGADAGTRKGDALGHLLLVGIIIAAYATRNWLESGTTSAIGAGLLLGLIAGQAFALLAFTPRARRFAIGVALCLLLPAVLISGRDLATARSFFGVTHVRLTDNGETIQLLSGTTLHGAQSLRPGERNLPMTYYAPGGAFARFIATLPPNPSRRIAAVGLGAGALACYAKPGETWSFHEIDPVIVTIARDTRFFHFLADCGADIPIILGDARLTLAKLPDNSLDALIIDAFSSDSIPVHLVTREAIALYRAKLRPDGRLLVHITNRYLDLRPVLAALAADAGMQARLLSVPTGVNFIRNAPATVVAIGADLANLDDWLELPRPAPRYLWTDQHSDLIGIFRQK